MNTFWKNKNVLITGYEGFVGSHLTKKMLEFKANVFGLDILTHRKNTILNKDFSQINIIKGNVENYSLIIRKIKHNEIDFIFHLAATSIIGKAFKNPLRAFSTNIKGTWNILEAARQSKTIEGLIVASSDKAYGSHKELPYKENSPLLGTHPYDVSKSCADLICYTYWNTYKVPVCVTRCGNIYGPGDFNYSRLIPDAIRCILRNKQFIIRSDGKFTRDYVYVEDIVNGYIMLAEKMKRLELYGEAFNFSDENPITVIDLVKKIYKILGKKENYKVLNQAKLEIRHQYLASAKARKILHWKPKFSLENGLGRTIVWYRNFLEK